MHFALSALHHRVLEALLRTGWIPFSTTGANVLHTIMAEHIPCFMCYKIYSTHSLKALANIPDEAYAACGFLDALASFKTLWSNLESFILKSSVIRKLDGDDLAESLVRQGLGAESHYIAQEHVNPRPGTLDTANVSRKLQKVLYII